MLNKQSMASFMYGGWILVLFTENMGSFRGRRVFEPSIGFLNQCDTGASQFISFQHERELDAHRGVFEH
jgi:hypothetical protein